MLNLQLNSFIYVPESLKLILKLLQRKRKNRSHLYSRANKRWIPFKQTSKHNNPLPPSSSMYIKTCPNSFEQ
ncbi:hypothetical protein ACE6H2_006464 [Prunus campanulata]